MSLKINIDLTNSKIIADIIIILSIIYAFVYNDGTIFIGGIGLGAGLLGWKQQKDKELKNKKTV